MRNITDFINNAELGRDNLPVEESSTPPELRGFKPLRAISETTFERVPERLRSGTEDTTFFPGEDREDKIAHNTSGWKQAGQTLYNTAIEATVGTLEGAALLPGVDNLLQTMGESETGYGNFLSDIFKDVKETMKSDVYQTKESRDGFAPLDASWWAANSETLASTLTLMIPAMGAMGLLSKVGRLSKLAAMRNIPGVTKGLSANANVVAKVEGMAQTLGAAGIQRWTENTMEAQSNFEETYQEAIAMGLSDEEARLKAGESAAKVWNLGWMNIAQDALQFGTIGKGVGKFFGRTDKALAMSKKARAAALGGVMASESLEEAGQYMISKESTKSVLDDDYKFSGLFDRMIDDYVKDPEFHTSMFFGAIGGGIFKGAGDIISHYADKRTQKAIDERKQKINAVLNDDYVKAAGIDASLVFNKSMAYIEMDVLDDLKDSINLEITRSDEELLNEGKRPEEIEEYRKKMGEVLTDIDFIADTYMDSNNQYRDPLVVRQEVAMEYSLRKFGRAAKDLQNEYNNLVSESLKADGSQEVLTRVKDIATMNILKARLAEIEDTKDDGSSVVKNPEEVKSFINERIKSLTDEITARLPEKMSIEKYLKGDTSTKISNVEALNKNIYAQEDMGILMQDARNELEHTKSDNTEFFNKRNERTKLNKLKDDIRNNVASNENLERLLNETDPELSKFRDDLLEAQNKVDIPLGEDRVSAIQERYNGKNLLFVKEKRDMFNSNILTKGLDTVEDFIAKYNSDTNFKKKVDDFYDTKAKADGRFYDTTDLVRENIQSDGVDEDGSAIVTEATSASVGRENIVDSLHVALAKIAEEDKNLVVFQGYGETRTMSLQDYRLEHSDRYLSTEFSPVYMKDGSVVPNSFNEFTDTDGNKVTIISSEAQRLLNDPNTNFNNSEVRYRVYPKHPEFSPTTKGKEVNFLIGVEVKQENGSWITVGRLSALKEAKKAAKVRAAVLREYNKSKFETIDLGSKVNVKVNGFVRRKEGAKNPFHTVFGEDAVIAVVMPSKQTGYDLVYGNLSDEMSDEVGAVANRSKLADYVGHTVLMVKQSDGYYAPIKLRTKKLNQVPELLDKALQYLEEFEASDHSEEKMNTLETKLDPITFLRIQRTPQGKYRHLIHEGGDTPKWSDPMTFSELKEHVRSTKAVRVDIKRINDKRYHRDHLIKYNVLETDISPDNTLLGASLAIDLNIKDMRSEEEKQADKKKATAKVEQKPKEEVVSTETLVSVEDLFGEDIIKEVEETIEETTTTETTNIKDKKFDLFDDDDTRTREVKPDADFTPMKESEKEWFKKYYPNEDPQIVDDLSTVIKKGGTELFGLYRNGLVYLREGAATGTLYHEAFHLVFNSMLSDKERKDILAQQRYLKDKDLTKNATDIDVEESLADQYMDVQLTDGKIIDTYTGKIKDFFKRLWNIMQIFFERKGLKGSPSIETLFYRVDRGLYTNFPKFKRNVTRFRKDVYGDLSIAEAKMAAQIIANDVVNRLVNVKLREHYNMPDASIVDIIKYANKLANKKYKRKSHEEELNGYTFNDLLIGGPYRLLNKKKNETTDEVIKNNISRILTALAHIDENGNSTVKELKNLVVGEMMNYGIKADVSNINMAVSRDITEDEDGVSEDQTDESFDFKDRFTSSLKDFRSSSRLLFASIPNSNRSFAGFPLFHDPSTVYNTLKKYLESSLSKEDMMKRLEEQVYVHHPDYEDVISEAFMKDPSLSTDFYRNFAQRNNTTFIKLIHNKDGSKTVTESNRSNVVSDIRSDWFENFMNSSDYYDTETNVVSDKNKEEAQKVLDRIEALIGEIGKNRSLTKKQAEAAADILYDAGIRMDSKVIVTNLMKETSGPNTVRRLLVNTPNRKGISLFFQQIARGINPFEISDTDENEIGSSLEMSKALDNITKEISQMFPEMRSSMFQNGKRKSVDSNLLPRDSMRRLLRFKNDYTLLTNIGTTDPFWSESKYINEVFSETNNLKEIKFAIFDTFQAGKRSGDNQEYSELSAKNFHTALINLFFNFGANNGPENESFGWFGMPIPSDSTAYNIIKLPKFKTVEEAFPYLVDAVNNERNRIKWLESVIRPNQQVYDEWRKLPDPIRKHSVPEVFKDIPFAMLLNGLKYQIFPELNEGDRAKVMSDQQFKDSILESYNNYKNRFFEDLVAKNVLTTVKGRYEIADDNLDKRVAKDNKLESNLERFLINATIANIQTAFIFAGDIAYYKHDKNKNLVSIEDFFKRVKQINSPGTYLDVDAEFKVSDTETIKGRRKYKVAVVSDKEIVSSHLDAIVKIEEDHVKDVLKYSTAEVKAHVDFIKDKYSKINITDAFTAIDLYRYREIAIQSAQWTQAKNTLYNRIMNGEIVDPKDMEIFQPFKPFRFGIEVVNGRYVPIQHKNAEMLITPQMAKYNDVHRIALEKMGYSFKEDGTFTFDEKGRDTNKYIDALMYNSSVKVGEMYTVANEESINPDKAQLFDNDDYRIQMGTPEHFVNAEVNIGSQIRKLLMEGFDVNDGKTYVIEGITDKEGWTASQIIGLYNDLITKNLQSSYEKVKTIFTDSKGKVDRQRMVQELKKAIIERELGTDYLEAVELIDGSPTIPYWYPTISYNLQAIFSAFYKNNITKQQMSGMALFNSSSVGYKATGELRKPQIVFGKDGNIEHIEALIPIHDKRLLKFVDPSTGLVDIDKVSMFDERLLKGLFYRIPSEDKYSMAHIKVIGFLPSEMGAQIILPDEITTIAGLDFDIDKMFGLIYEKDKDGRTVESSMDTVEGRNNMMLDLAYGIMQLKETAARQLSPGNFDNLTKVKDDILGITEADTSLNFASQISKIEVQQRNMMGKELIGTFANHRVNHVLFTFGNFNLLSPIEFDGHSLTSLSEKISPIDNKPIGQRLATFVAAVVDNAKDPIASMLNLIPALADVAGMMIRVGYSEDLVGKFLSQKVFVEMGQDYSNSSAFGSVEVMKILREKLSNIKLSNDLIKEAKNLSITSKVLKDNLKSPDPIVDYALLSKMIEMYESADMLRKMMGTMRYDSTSKSAGPTYFDTEARTIEYQDMVTKENKYISGYQEFMTNPNLQWVREFYNLGVETSLSDMMTVMELPYTNGIFTQVKDYFTKWKQTGTLTASELDVLSRAVMTINAASFGPFSIERSTELMTSFPDRFQSFKNDYPQYRILTGLITVEQPKKVDKQTRFTSPLKMLKFNKRGITPSHMQVLRSQWTEMMESSDENVRNFAIDLATYTFFTSGFMFKQNSLLDAIPVTWMTELTSNGKTFLQHMTEMNNSESMSDNNINEIVRNLYQSMNVIGEVTDKEIGVDISLKDNGIYSGNVDSNFNKIHTVEDKKKVFSPFIKFNIDNDVRLMEFVEVSKDNKDVAFYREVQPLGIHNKYVQFSDGNTFIGGVIGIGVSKVKEQTQQPIQETVEQPIAVPEKIENDILEAIEIAEEVQTSNFININNFNISKTLKNFLIEFFNSQDENIINVLADKLTTEDKLWIAKSVGRTYKDINQFNWYNDIWSNVEQEEIFYYLITKNNLEQVIEKEKTDSKLFKDYQTFIEDNKQFANDFKTFTKEIQQEQQKEFNKLKEKEKWFNFELDNLKYEIRKNLLKKIGYGQSLQQLTGDNVNEFRSLQMSIGEFLADQKEKTPMTITEAVDSFESYDANPTDIPKDAWNTMSLDEKLAHWYSLNNC